MCNLCKIQPVYEFTNKRTLCRTCFIRWFEKKVFYTIRKFNMIKREDKIFCEKHGNFRDSVLLDVMKIYCSKSGNLMITSKKNFNKIVCSNNLDLNSYKFINILREKKDNSLKKLSPVVGEKIYPLYFFLDKEILIYAELKKLKYKKEIVKRSSLLSEKDSWINFLNDLEKKHPEIKNAIMNSYLKIIY